MMLMRYGGQYDEESSSAFEALGLERYSLKTYSIHYGCSICMDFDSALIDFLLSRCQLEDGSSSELHLQPLLRPTLGWHVNQDKHGEEQHQPRLARGGRGLLHCAQPGAGTAGLFGDISMESVVNQGNPIKTIENI